jgi:hypothetical protein
MTVIEDVTERVVSDRELRGRIAASEAASRVKDEFLATLSHEMRTPLNAVLGWSRILRTRRFDDSTLTRAIDVIDRNATAQLTLITDMLDMARISSGKVRLETRSVDLRAVALAHVHHVRGAAGHAAEIRGGTIHAAYEHEREGARGAQPDGGETQEEEPRPMGEDLAHHRWGEVEAEGDAHDHHSGVAPAGQGDQSRAGDLGRRHGEGGPDHPRQRSADPGAKGAPERAEGEAGHDSGGAVRTIQVGEWRGVPWKRYNFTLSPAW